jgi:hypothetical protein
MSSRSVADRASRGPIVFALVVCGAWLVVQNLALLLMAHWSGAPEVLGVVRAVVRAGWPILQQLGPMVGTVALSCAVAGVLLMSVMRTRAGEVGHGRAH